MIISGSKNGDVVVWVHNPGQNPDSNWTVRKHMDDHESQVANIHINEDMCLYITSSFDGTANLYNFWTDSLIRTFKHPNLSPIHSVILSQNPLPALAFYSREDHHWYSFSINGAYLDK
jgi:WD40 repeat protein